MRLLLTILTVLLAAACSDPYDPAKMDLKPVPAKVSAERPKGAFAAGPALSMGAEPTPRDRARTKTIRLETTDKLIESAPGVKYSGWTFGGQVPGPTVRVRVGD